MEHSASRKVASRTSVLVAMLALSVLSQAGDFSFTPGSWSNVITTGTTSGLLYASTSNPTEIASSLSLKAIASGTYTAKGTWSFTATWTPATTGETPPANVKITLWHHGATSVTGNGVAKVTAGATDLIVVNSTNISESGRTRYLDDVVLTLPLQLQSDGTYKATGSLMTNTLSATFDSQNAASTNVTESYALANIEAVAQ